MRKLLSLSALIILIDQATKLAIHGFDFLGIHCAGLQNQSVMVLGDFFRLTYLENPGMAFGLNPETPYILSIFSIAAAIFLVYLIKRTSGSGNNGLRLAFALILGGAVGNMIDRVFYGVLFGYDSLFHGRVVDFIDIDIPDVNLFGHQLNRFYVFNIADAAVSIGVILLLIFYPTKKKETAPAITEAPAPPEGLHEHPPQDPADDSPDAPRAIGSQPPDEHLPHAESAAG
ncbi:MAG: signal peptidase II [Bacteroidetes bacterium]|nr:signal peptidase II [Bacteroidota bacterium]